MTAVLTAPDVPPVPAPAAPAPAALGVVALAVATALLLVGGPPGLGVALLGVAGAGALLLSRHWPRTGWQAVHCLGAVLLAGSAVLRDAPWVVALDLLGALGLACLALAPTRTWAGVLLAPLRVALRLRPATGWLARGLRPLLVRGRDAGPVVRGAALAAGLLVVFVPLLTSADPSFARLLGRLVPDTVRIDVLTGRLVVLVLALPALAAACSVLLDPPAEPQVNAATRLLTRRSEWLPPLLALDVLLSAFLVVQGDPRGRVPVTPGTTYAEQVHAGFGQLVVVTALVLAVVAGAVRWTRVPTGVRAALGVLCGLALVVDASAVARLHDYI